MWAESCVPTGTLDDSIVSLVTDSRRLRKGGTGSDAWEASTQTEELEIHPC